MRVAIDTGKGEANVKLGSMFDGSGTMPLCAAMCGAQPVWASEVEPYPIAVTKTHLPGMKHLGSVTDICGGENEPGGVLTFCSPGQGFRISGKRGRVGGKPVSFSHLPAHQTQGKIGYRLFLLKKKNTTHSLQQHQKKE